MSFKIVVDSCCDLTPQMRKDPCFVKVPLSIHANGSVFVDDDTLDQADLLWSMRQSEDAPSTACPSPQAYLDAYQGEEGEDVYVVTLSALLSGSHNSAEQARVLLEEEQPERNIHVFNSCFFGQDQRNGVEQQHQRIDTQNKTASSSNPPPGGGGTPPLQWLRFPPNLP